MSKTSKESGNLSRKNNRLIMRNNRLKFCNRMSYPRNEGFLDTCLWARSLGKLIKEFLHKEPYQTTAGT